MSTATDHREYVGGLWDTLGPMQLSYLRRHGLRPDHYLLDIGCGCLRGGVHLIRYLRPGRYFGVDRHRWLLDAGLEELGSRLVQQKRPQLYATDRFQFGTLPARPDFAWAQSLFTHLPLRLIRLCLANLRAVSHGNTTFLATFFERGKPIRQPRDAPEYGQYQYARRQLFRIGNATGWHAQYLGGWDHPRGQVMMRFRPFLS